MRLEDTEYISPQRALLRSVGILSVIGLLILGLFSDGLSLWLHHTGSPFWRISLIVRAGFFFVSIFLGLLLRTEKKDSFGFILGGFVISAASLTIGYLLDPWFEFSDYLGTFLMMIKYVSVFFVYLLIRELARVKGNIDMVAKISDFVIMIYALFVFVGLASGNEMFRTYDDFRPGYKGIIFAQNETTGFMLLAIAWFYLRAFLGFRSWIWLAIVSLAAMLVGTKGLLVGVPLMILALSIAFFGARKAIAITAVIGGVTAYAGWYAYSNVDMFTLSVDKFLGAMSWHYHNTSNESLFSLLVSGRDSKIDILWERIINTAPWFMMFGGTPIGGYNTESDPVDIVAAFGFPFSVLFLYGYARVLFNDITSQPAWHRRFVIAFSLIWFGIALTGGHLLGSGICGPYVAILLCYCKFGGYLQNGKKQPVSEDLADANASGLKEGLSKA